MGMYDIINDFFIRHIEEIAFIFVSLIYIFFYRYLFVLSERIFKGLTFSLFENKPSIMTIIGFVDSFFVFIITLILIIPLFKKVLHSYIEPILDTYYLTFIVLIFFTASYIYYILVYRRHIING